MNLSQRIANRIRRKGVGWVFTPTDFIEWGTRHAVGITLLRLVRAGQIRRLSRGMYDTPKKHKVLGLLHPRPEAVVDAVRRQEGAEILEHEAYSANRLNLTEQVPARLLYLTSGRSRTIQAGPLTLEFQHRSPRKLSAPHAMSAMVFSALRNIGKANVDAKRIGHLKGLMKAADRKRLLQDLPRAPSWMHPHLRTIAGDQERP